MYWGPSLGSPGTADWGAACLNSYTKMQRHTHTHTQADTQTYRLKHSMHSFNRQINSSFFTRSPSLTHTKCFSSVTLWHTCRPTVVSIYSFFCASPQTPILSSHLHVSWHAPRTCTTRNARRATRGFNLMVKTAATSLIHRLSFCFNN